MRYTRDEIDEVMARMFPGEPVTDDDGVVWVHREYPPQFPVAAPPSLPEPRLNFSPAPKRERAAKVSRLVEERRLPPPPAPITAALSEDPVVPLLPKRPYLLESCANVELWLKEAQELQSALLAKQPTSVPHLTRLMLEAIPVVERLLKP